MMIKRGLTFIALGLGMLLPPVSGSAAQEYLFPEVYSMTNNAFCPGGITLDSISGMDGLLLFPYYLKINLPSENNTAWGVQLYTDNLSLQTFSDPSGVFGGLRGVTNPLDRLPLYWQVYDQCQDATASWGQPVSITTTAGGLGFYPDTLQYWGRLYDRNDADVASTWMGTSNLANRTVAGYRGLGAFPLANRRWDQPPAYLYLGMDLRSMIQPQQFSTVVHLDLYNLGVDITSGGYATPNPFTPTTGQKTFFNFYLKNIASPFVVKIYTLRGRLIRTLTGTREWDGRNDSGQWVEGGLYLYQISAEGKRVSGTVVLIK